MAHDLTIAADDIRLLHELLPARDARRTRLLALALAEFEVASDKAACAGRLAAELAAQGVRGVSVKSLYRKAKLLRERGIMGLVDERLIKRGATGIADNEAFAGYWAALCAANKRKTAPAYRALFAELAAGKHIPGVGTWRAVWAAEHGGIMPPDDMPCPYQPYTDVPPGWSLRSLARIAPNKYALTAARTGTMAAAMAYIPDIPRTRAGLAPCQVVQLDDMWHEAKVSYGANKLAQRVVELSMIDLLTGKLISWLAKPVRERDDGTREVLRSEWVRYFAAHLLCGIGIPEAGCLIMAEHGTAAADSELKAVMDDITGGKVRWGAGGLLSQPLARGLYDGRPRGNPRYKGLLEGFHGLVKNELGAARGVMGGGRDREPETVYGMDKRDNMLRQIAMAVEARRPGMLDRLRLPYLPFADFMELVAEAYWRIDNRTHHELEGWEQCGFVTGEWRPTPDSHWLPMASLERMDANAAAAFRALIAADPSLFRTRRLSPAEAWASRAGELTRLGGWAAPLIMGDKLARRCVCGDKLTLDYRDATTERKLQVAGIVDGTALTRGEMYMVWINPLADTVAYVADADGRYIGEAAVMQAANHDDLEGMQRNLGIRQQAIAAERRAMAPIIRAQLASANDDARHNAMQILGHDPAADQAAADAAAMEAAGAGVTATTEDLVAMPTGHGDSVTLDDLI